MSAPQQLLQVPVGPSGTPKREKGLPPSVAARTALLPIHADPSFASVLVSSDPRLHLHTQIKMQLVQQPLKLEEKSAILPERMVEFPSSSEMTARIRSTCRSTDTISDVAGV